MLAFKGYPVVIVLTSGSCHFDPYLMGSYTSLAFFCSPAECLGAVYVAIHDSHDIVKRFIVSPFCTHHHESSHQLWVRKALGAFLRLHLCPLAQPMAVAHQSSLSSWHNLKDMSLLGSKASAASPGQCG